MVFNQVQWNSEAHFGICTVNLASKYSPERRTLADVKILDAPKMFGSSVICKKKEDC